MPQQESKAHTGRKTIDRPQRITPDETCLVCGIGHDEDEPSLVGTFPDNWPTPQLLVEHYLEEVKERQGIEDINDLVAERDPSELPFCDSCVTKYLYNETYASSRHAKLCGLKLMGYEVKDIDTIFRLREGEDAPNTQSNYNTVTRSREQYEKAIETEYALGPLFDPQYNEHSE